MTDQTPPMSIPLREGELLPCPFCGSAARLDRKVGRAGTACPSGWLREKVVCRNRKCEVSGPVFKRPGVAIAAWNTRSTPPSRPQGEEELRAVLETVADLERFVSVIKVSDGPNTYHPVQVPPSEGDNNN